MQEQNDRQSDDFSKRMTDILNYGALNLAMAIGYETRLFDTMDEMAEPATAAQIADNARLNRRYIREWLGVMVSGGIVDLEDDPSGQDRFFLPKARADLITRRAGNANMGVYTQEIPLLTTCALAPVLEGFRSGQGVGYDRYPAFQAFMTQLANAKHEAVLVDKFLPSILDGHLVELLGAGLSVCDVGCGEGVAVLLMADAFPQSRFIGIDISADALGKAARMAKEKMLTNVSFVQMDITTSHDQPEYQAFFDYITAFDAIHDQTRPMEALVAIHRMLKKGGLFSMVDIAAGSRLKQNKDHPMGPFLYTVSLMHCMPVGLDNGGAGLGMMWGKELAGEMLNAAGFRDVQVLEIPDDAFNLHFLCRK